MYNNTQNYLGVQGGQNLYNSLHYGSLLVMGY